MRPHPQGTHVRNRHLLSAVPKRKYDMSAWYHHLLHEQRVLEREAQEFEQEFYQQFWHLWDYDYEDGLEPVRGRWHPDVMPTRCVCGQTGNSGRSMTMKGMWTHLGDGLCDGCL